MGISFGINCRECDYAKNLKLGIGMAYSPSNLVDFSSEFGMLRYLIRSKNTLQYVKMLITEKGGRIPYTYEHSIYHCPRCSEFYERFFYHIDYEGGTYEPKYQCSKCKAVLEKITGSDNDENIDLSKYPCPKCGKYSLSEDYSSVIMWD